MKGAESLLLGVLNGCMGTEQHLLLSEHLKSCFVKELWIFEVKEYVFFERTDKKFYRKINIEMYIKFIGRNFTGGKIVENSDLRPFHIAPLLFDDVGQEHDERRSRNYPRSVAGQTELQHHNKWILHSIKYQMHCNYFMIYVQFWSSVAKK